MSRTEQFAVGVALIGTALSIILQRDFLAYLVLFLGLAIICNAYVQDIIWGKDRPSWEEIQRMGADHYKSKVLDKKFERWFNHVSPEGRKNRWLLPSLTIAVLLGIFISLWRLRHQEAGQWILESYNAEQGYVLSKDGATYEAHCRAYFPPPPKGYAPLPLGSEIPSGAAFSRLPNPHEMEIACSNVLPYLHKPVPLEYFAGSDDVLNFTETRDGPFKGYTYQFSITDAK
jgi:hypothetical protein